MPNELSYTLDPDGRGVTVTLVPDTAPPIDDGGKTMLTKETIRAAIQPWIPILMPVTLVIPGVLDDLLLRLAILMLNDDQFLDKLLVILNGMGIGSLAQLRAATNTQIQAAFKQAMTQMQKQMSCKP